VCRAKVQLDDLDSLITPNQGPDSIFTEDNHHSGRGDGDGGEEEEGASSMAHRALVHVTDDSTFSIDDSIDMLKWKLSNVGFERFLRMTDFTHALRFYRKKLSMEDLTLVLHLYTRHTHMLLWLCSHSTHVYTNSAPRSLILLF
jgi:hypothetical protein